MALQLSGAVLILIAYVLSLFRILKLDSWAYLLPNFVGASVLTVDAHHGGQWGFFLLEGVWALVTSWSIIDKLRRRKQPTPSSASKS